MHKHANETRAGAGNSDSCSRLNAATDAAAPGRAFQVAAGVAGAAAVPEATH